MSDIAAAAGVRPQPCLPEFGNRNEFGGWPG